MMNLQSLDLKKFPEIVLPRFLKVEQNFEAVKIDNIPEEITGHMQPHLNDLAGKRIAVGVGSRGIANLAIIAKSVIENLKNHGKPRWRYCRGPS
jgi:hypothetical protein